SRLRPAGLAWRRATPRPCPDHTGCANATSMFHYRNQDAHPRGGYGDERRITLGAGPRLPDVNAGHRKLCSSARWGEYIRIDLLPWMLGDRPLGGSVLEIGPGPGRST